MARAKRSGRSTGTGALVVAEPLVGGATHCGVSTFPRLEAMPDHDVNGSESTRRKLPIQLANEARMIDAAITLLHDHSVGGVTNVAVAEASHTQPSYVTRYFGNRDRFLLAVAEELSARIATFNLGLAVLAAAPDGNTRITSVFAIPDVDSWFKLWRYLAGRDVAFAVSKMGEGPLLVAGVENLERNFGFPPGEARVWALISMTAVLGYRIFGDLLGVTPEDAVAIADKIIGALLRASEELREESKPPGEPD
jgi:AcrR family transcriptional regulator